LVTIGHPVAAFWGALSPNCHQNRSIFRPLRVLNRDSCEHSAS